MALHDPRLAFCVWVLKIDGLQVPPFDLHGDGDHSLRRAGMDAESWRRWTRRVADTVHESRAAYESRRPSVEAIISGYEPRMQELEEQWAGRRGVSRALTGAQWLLTARRKSREMRREHATWATRFVSPVEQFDGSSGSRMRLAELWKRFRSLRTLHTLLQDAPPRMTEDMEIVSKVSAAHRELGGPPILVISFVNYSSAAVYVAGPSVVLAGVAALPHGEQAWHDVIERARAAAGRATES